MDPFAVSIIFSSYYLNNPASAFGHTLLRIHKRRELTTEKRQELLDYGIDFSADVDTSNPVLYAIKGLSGMFPATFKRLPFYYKVRKYNDYEFRDLWTYELNFPQPALIMLVAHLWELGGTYFDYYYMTENCSYHILGLLEAAYPELELLKHVNVPVLPADTIKALFYNPSLVKQVSHRPSARNQLAARLSALDASQSDWVGKLLEDPDRPLPSHWTDETKILVLDAAADLVDVRYMKALIFKRNSSAALLKQKLLARRSSIPKPSQDLETKAPVLKRPEFGHDSKRFDVSGGYHSKGKFFGQLDFRLALHDLADPAPGYPDLAQIEFLKTKLRYWQEGHKLKLQHASFVRIISLHSIEQYDFQLSWNVDAGATTVYRQGWQACLAANAEVGAGPAKAFFSDAVVLFLTMDTQILAGPNLMGLGDLHGVRIGAGPSAGYRLRFTQNLLWTALGKFRWFPTQQTPLAFSLVSNLRYAPFRQFALDLQGSVQNYGIEAKLGTLFYF
ncbi:MAG: DUF4105 domain-containing protein [Myxococcales bacterium]|nr:MAG: DUF4105 domain-containing protein [Myxococcales bacterium]